MACRKDVKIFKITMPIERSAGAVLFRSARHGREYLLLHHPNGLKPLGEKGYWSFPKGHIEKGEKSLDAALREIQEESGLVNIKIIPGFKEAERYSYSYEGKKVLKFVVWFLAESRVKRIKISSEHDDFTWLTYPKAYKAMTYRGTREILKKAHRFLAHMK